MYIFLVIYFSILCAVIDKFLTAGGPCQEDEAKRVVCLIQENDSDKQLWSINKLFRPVEVKMEPDDTDTPSRTARKRTHDEASF